MTRTALALIAVLATMPARAADLSACPLDRMTFSDPWTGTLFIVDALRSNATETALIGRVSDPQMKQVSAQVAMVRSTGTSDPVWNVASSKDPQMAELTARTTTPAAIPAFGQAGFGEITFDARSTYSRTFENNFDKLVPASCR